MEQIVQRDFFPDVTKLQAQNDYLEAEENGDLQRMREIAIKYGSAMAKYTPRTYVPCELHQCVVESRSLRANKVVYSSKLLGFFKTHFQLAWLSYGKVFIIAITAILIINSYASK